MHVHVRRIPFSDMPEVRDVVAGSGCGLCECNKKGCGRSKGVAVRCLSAEGQVSSHQTSVPQPSSLSLSTPCRILHEILTQGYCHAPKVSHPLPLSRCLPAALFHGTVLMAFLGTRVGRLSWLSLLGMFTAVTFLSPLLTKK